MGYFTNLYVVEVEATDKNISVITSVYDDENGKDIYFSWGPGERYDQPYSFANETLFSDSPLEPRYGYPRTETYDDIDRFYIEASFMPRNQGDPVLLHILLPKGYVPRRDLEPLVQPCVPFVYIHNEQVVITYPTSGRTEARFWVTKLSEEEDITHFDERKFLNPLVDQPLTMGFELNLGIFKITFSR